MNDVHFLRQSKGIKNMIRFLSDNKKSFTVQHGTYTTKIINPDGKLKYQTTSFDQRVFIASQMIRRDVLASELGQKIIASSQPRTNFGYNESIVPFEADRVLNIDISSAYASALYNSGMITEKTHAYLRRMKKEERLPAMGMLARSSCSWVYKDGKCVEIVPKRADTAQIFFYLIAEINYVMQSVKWELGKYFYFYWVDGFFFDYNTPVPLITKVENILTDKGYHYKYELVEDFKLTLDKKKVYTIDMVKNGDRKRYQFSQNHLKEAKDILNALKTKAHETI